MFEYYFLERSNQQANFRLNENKLICGRKARGSTLILNCDLFCHFEKKQKSLLVSQLLDTPQKFSQCEFS